MARIFFLQIFKIFNPHFPPLQICGKKFEKILTYTPAYQLFYEKITKFLNLPLRRYEFLNFGYFGHIIRVWVGGLGQNFFGKVLHQQ